MKVTLQREARYDLEDAAVWYEGKVRGLGGEFLREVENSFDRIAEFPESYPVVHKKLRRYVLGRFPFCIFYMVANERIDVVAVLHATANRVIGKHVDRPTQSRLARPIP